MRNHKLGFILTSADDEMCIRDRTGSAFEEAANRANILSRYISTAKDKTTVYKKEIDGLNTIIKRSGEEQAKLKTKIENTSSQYEKSKEKLNSISDAVSYTHLIFWAIRTVCNATVSRGTEMV